METFLIRALQLILSLSILVFVHELGHFLFARLFKVRVDKFYLFFNPKISLVRAKKVNGKWQVRFFSPNVPANERPKVDADGDIVTDAQGHTVYEPIPLDELPDDDWRKYPDATEWGIGWVPLGGYCKIAGMVDESMDTTQLAQAPQPWEYRSRPAWQRLPIICGGVLFNFIGAIIIYIGLLYSNGKEYFPMENARYGLEFTQLMQDNGFRNGDRIVAIDGEAPADRADAVERMLIDGRRHVTVVRAGGDTAQVVLPEDFAQQVLAAEDNTLLPCGNLSWCTACCKARPPTTPGCSRATASRASTDRACSSSRTYRPNWPLAQLDHHPRLHPPRAAHERKWPWATTASWA